MIRYRALCMLIVLPTGMGAQTTDARRSVYLVVDNDLIALRGAGRPPDHDYTHGSKLGVAWLAAPGLLRRTLGASSGCPSKGTRHRARVTMKLELGQEIYTPRRDSEVPVPGERPYAGWLYVSSDARLSCPRHVRAVGIALGMTGPPSLAAQVQNGLHRMLSNERQLGWTHQVAFEPGLMLRYEEGRLRQYPLAHRLAAGLGMRWGAIVGNVRTALYIGASGRVGRTVQLPWAPAEYETWEPMQLYGIVDYQHDLVMRDLTLDGNTFRASARVQRRTMVGQYKVGFGLRRRSYTIEYRHVVRGREYRAQPKPHAYGAIAFTLHSF
jgi:lipid A 3-O-deacylase